MSYLMGIDVGTTATRAVIIHPNGSVKGAATEDHVPMRMPKPGWAEQSPDDWWRAAIAAVRAALERAGTKGASVGAVGLSGQMHGVTLLDKSNAVLRPAIIWCDQRTQKQCDWITSRVGAARLIQWVSNPALTGFSAPKLLWIREHEPQLYERAVRALLPKDFVRLKLTAEFATDVSDASGTLLLDVAKRSWCSEVMDKLQMDRQLMPPVYESVAVTGQVTSEAAVLTGLRAGTPVVAGAGDQAASAVGNGIVSSGLISSTLGTSGVVFAYTDAPKTDPRGRVHTFCHAVPNKWHVMGVTQGAGLSLRWFREQFGESEAAYARRVGLDPYEVIIREAESIPPGSGNLLFLPYLMGERTPHLDALARGMWFGLTAGHTRGHLLRSILEGVAFSLRDSIEILRELEIPVREVRASGGGSRSRIWRQIQADVYGEPLVTLRESEGSAYGAAMLAGVGIKAYATVEEAAKRTIRISDRIAPIADNVRRYHELYSVYRRLYPAVRSLSHELANLDD
jgi:xylulokinase